LSLKIKELMFLKVGWKWEIWLRVFEFTSINVKEIIVCTHIFIGLR